MARTQTASHPFALLLDPQAVFHAVEKSQRLETLQRRICRPLDKPLLPVLAGSSDAQANALADGDDDRDLELEDGLDAGIDGLGEANA